MPNPLDDAKVYTLADLKVWETLRPGLPPSLAVLGHPVAHSVSPQMHNAALDFLVKQGHEKLKDWRYFKFDIEPEELGEALTLFKKNNFAGLNLTIPHKVSVGSLIAENKKTFQAEKSGAINTLYCVSDVWSAENTDGYGFSKSIKSYSGNSLSLKGRDIVMLGIGGAARAVAVQCLTEGCASLWIGGRRENLDLSEIFYNESRVKYFNLTLAPIGTWPDNIILVNATPLGMKPNDPLPIDVVSLPKKAFVFDMIYRSDGTTPLVTEARKHGLSATDGLGMLVWQGAQSLSMWLFNQGVIKNIEARDLMPESIAPTMMSAACTALGLPPRHA